VNALKPKFPEMTDADFANNKQTVGPEFGASFFTQTLKAIFMAFLFMSIVIFLYFGESVRDKWIASILTIVAALMMFYANSIILYIVPLLLFIVLVVIYIRDSIPAFGIVLCAFSDIFFSLAIFNLFGYKLSTAGVAAFLMLVGYSIDTDILLSVRVLKRHGGTIFDRTLDALKTGVTMSVCALIAVSVALIFTHSIVIKEIMFILLVGLIGDIIFTWIQNAGILRWHLEKKGWK
jgi:preprotein translocase subunit SecF